jgi:hypothetical protein
MTNIGLSVARGEQERTYEVSDVLIGVGFQRCLWHDKTKCVAARVPPCRERNVCRRIRVHDGILRPASLSICSGVS